MSHLFVLHPDLHEGMLIYDRVRLFCNEPLAALARLHDLPRHIITKAVPYRDWTLLLSLASGHTPENRMVSSKILADVVEALIGASWIDADFGAARKCNNAFHPAKSLSAIHFNVSAAATTEIPFANADKIESLIQYKFNNRTVLLEAITHPSCGGHSLSDSYERFEYLGDAVLDMIVVQQMTRKLAALSPGRMAQMKAAVIKARLLGFLSLGLRLTETFSSVQTQSSRDTALSEVKREMHLATFTRFASSELAIAQYACQTRFDSHRGAIREKLRADRTYTWLELLRSRPEKFYSDIVQSILGEIFVDTDGDLQPCMAFLETIDVQDYLDHLMNEHVDVRNPRDRVQGYAGATCIKYKIESREARERYDCSLLPGDVVIAGVEACSSREEAITRVAYEVEQKLTAGLIVWYDPDSVARTSTEFMSV